MSPMPPFDGSRDLVGWIARTLGTGWTGGIIAARDGRTVSVNFSVSKATWSAGDDVGALGADFAPTFDRYLPLVNSGSGVTTWVLIYADGVVEVPGAGTAGLVGCITYIK